MNRSEVVSRFVDLFDGRRDCHGLDAGGCEWSEPDFDAHLFGAAPIGIYPQRGDGLARWGCIDIDEDNRGLVSEICRELTPLDVTPYVESSRSKGWHIWWFYGQWLPAWIPRTIGLMACHEVGVTLEVNPKQFVLPEGSPGNYVRLPYPMRHVDTWRQVVHADGELLPLLVFLDEVRLTSDNRRVAAASPLVPLEVAFGVKVPEFMPDAFQGHTRGSQSLWQEAARVVFATLPIQMGRRDNQLYTAACLMWGSGWSEERAVLRMHEIWAQQLEQGTGKDYYPEKIALEKVQRVYRQRGVNMLKETGGLQARRRREPVFT